MDPLLIAALIAAGVAAVFAIGARGGSATPRGHVEAAL